MAIRAAIAVIFAGALLGCSKSSTSASTHSIDAGAQGSSALTPEDAAKVLARIGDRTVTLGEFAATLEHMDSFDRLRYQSPERRKELLNEMINVELLANEAVRRGYDKDPLTEQEMRSVLRDAVLQDAKNGVPMPSEVPEDEVRQYFDAHKADYHDPERRRISVVVLADAASAASVLASAQKDTSVLTWGELVRAKSVDPQAQAKVPIDLAGDIGLVSPPGDTRGANPRIPEEVRAAAFEITKVNDVLGRVVKSGRFYYVVRLTQRSDAHDRTLQEAERSIRLKIVQEKIRDNEQRMLAALRAKYPVQIDETKLASVRVDLGADAGR